MQFEIINKPSQLTTLRDGWNCLSGGAPMQSLAWLATWWECYGDSARQLFVIVAREQGELVGIAPWYLETRNTRRVVRWLGDGRVCSDHPGLLCQPSQQNEFAEALATWLLDDANQLWDELQLEAVDLDPSDAAAQGCRQLINRLAGAGCPSFETEEPGSCDVELPPTWEDYLMSVSKNHRKRCRRWDKQFFQTGRARVVVAQRPDECLVSWQTLVQLHNARRTNLGEAGAFEDAQFANFHRQAIPRLAASQQVQLRVLEIDGQPLAAEYLLQDAQTWYAYQSGMSAAGEEISAGSLSIMSIVRDAIAAGCTRLDLLRGDEAYKFSWGAVHRPATKITVRRPTYTAQLLTLRDTAWHAAKRLRRSVKSRA